MAAALVVSSLTTSWIDLQLHHGVVALKEVLRFVRRVGEPEENLLAHEVLSAALEMGKAKSPSQRQMNGHGCRMDKWFSDEGMLARIEAIKKLVPTLRLRMVENCGNRLNKSGMVVLVHDGVNGLRSDGSSSANAVFPLHSAGDLFAADDGAVVSEPVLAEQGEQPLAIGGLGPVVWIEVLHAAVIERDAEAVAVDRHLTGRMDHGDNQVDVALHVGGGGCQS